jgi:peptidase E
MLQVLGPQRPTPNAPACLEAFGGEGTILVLTAGWRHEETDDEALRRHLGPDVVVLPLYTWFEVVMKELPELRAAYRARQDAWIRMRSLHRYRLTPALNVVQDLWAAAVNGDDPVMRRELDGAMAHVRALDVELCNHVEAIRSDHAAAIDAQKGHKVVTNMVENAKKAIADARVVVITGGHVAVLLNRLRFFGVDLALAERHAAGGNIVAWSAGAMILTERVVLFYDDPPDGPSHPELLGPGIGLVKDIVMLPHARQRLRLDDANRVALLAQRMGPTACIGLENGAWLARDGDEWVNRAEAHTAVRLETDGRVSCLRCL